MSADIQAKRGKKFGLITRSRPNTGEQWPVVAAVGFLFVFFAAGVGCVLFLVPLPSSFFVVLLYKELQRHSKILPLVFTKQLGGTKP